MPYYTLKSIDNDGTGNSMLGNYSDIILDYNNNKEITGIIIRYQNSAIYHKYVFEERQLVSSKEKYLIEMKWLNNSESLDTKSDKSVENATIIKGNQNINELNRILKANLIEISSKLFRDKLGENINISDISLLEVVETELSSSNGTQKDYIVKLNKKNSESPWDYADLLLIFSPDLNKYKLTGSIIDKKVDYQLVDIDSDGIKEIVVEKINQHNWDVRDVTIYTLKNGKFNSVFDEGLVWSNNKCAYSFYNTFKFKSSDEDLMFLDIEFEVHTFFDMNNFMENKGNMNDVFESNIPKPINEVYHFKFDGKKYIPDKQLYNYRYESIQEK